MPPSCNPVILETFNCAVLRHCTELAPASAWVPRDLVADRVNSKRRRGGRFKPSTTPIHYCVPVRVESLSSDTHTASAMQGAVAHSAGMRAAFSGPQQRRSVKRSVRISAAAQDPLLLRVARGGGAGMVDCLELRRSFGAESGQWRVWSGFLIAAPHLRALPRRGCAGAARVHGDAAVCALHRVQR